MATTLTFSSLISDLQAYLERGTVLDSTVYNQLPRLINDAEREIAHALKVQGFLTNVVSSLVAGTSVFVKPDRWRQTVSMEFGTVGENPAVKNKRNLLYPRMYEYCLMYWPDSDVRDVPEFYADYDYYHWLIVPTPVATYPWQINYYQLPPLLDAGNQSNWMTEIIPTTLRYRVLMEASPFLKNDERVATWQPLYQQSIDSLTSEDLGKIVDRTTTRSKP